MPAPPSSRRHVRTRTRPAAASNVIQFRPRSQSDTCQEPRHRTPQPRASRAARLHDMAHRYGLAIDDCGVVTATRTGQVLFEAPWCLDGTDCTLLIELFLRLFERGVLAPRMPAGERGAGE